MGDQDKKKQNGLIWFCLGTIFGQRGLSKVQHAIYLTIIGLLVITAYTNTVQFILK